jgi:hypothetical protein
MVTPCRTNARAGGKAIVGKPGRLREPGIQGPPMRPRTTSIRGRRAPEVRGRNWGQTNARREGGVKGLMEPARLARWQGLDAAFLTR